MADDTATTLTAPSDDTTGADGGDDVKPDAGTPADGLDTTATDTKPAEPQGAPDEYAEFTAPEGWEMNSAAVESFTPVAKDLNLTQEQAQKLVDFHTGQIKALMDEQVQQLVDARKEWVESIKKDEEIGGAAMDRNVAVAVRALNKFATKEFRKALEETGLGDHPEMVRVFFRIGTAMAEATTDGGDKEPPAVKKSHAQTLYPNQEKI